MLRLSMLAAISIAALGCGDDSSLAGGGPAGGASGLGGAGEAPGLVCEGSLISKGPWSFAIDETTARVRWEACAAGSDGDLVFEPESGGEPVTVGSDESTFEL
ncbi:MAG: hypothetical protein JNK04_13645, partial [Myxococcales bacterium]|nr:hypothetical protein [Myxococcales bacterium]